MNDDIAFNSHLKKPMISDKLLQRVIQAYHGEVYGEALFGRLAKLSKNADEQTKWQLLMRLEQVIQQGLYNWLISNGSATEPEPKFQKKGMDEADKVASKNWLEAMQWLHDLTTPYVARYADMAAHEDLITEPDARIVLYRLADHEKALWLFAAEELANNPSSAQDFITKLLKD